MGRARLPIWDAGVARLVGRTTELTQIDYVLAGMGTDPTPAVVDIAGDAGIGKSRLLSELCVRAASSGLTALRGRATEYEQHLPFQVFADAFADADLDTPLTADNPLAARGPDVDRYGLYRSVAAQLKRLGNDGLVLVLDDMHWADPASRELLDYLIRHPAPGRVLLAVARRARQTPTALASTLTRGAHSGAVLSMTLEPLTERECIDTLAPDLPPSHARDLYTASDGNPLYLISLLHAYRQGTPVHDLDALGARSGLGSLLLEELSSLTEFCRTAVEAVAVLGDHATPRMLSLVTGLGEAELDSCTAELLRSDLLRPGSGGKWSLRHPLLRSLVYEHTAPQRRIAIHRCAAQELALTGAGAIERVHHLERSMTDWDPAAAEVLNEAAARLAGTAPATSAHLLEVVLRLMPDNARHLRRRGELMLARARVLGISGSLRESRDLLHTVIHAAGEEDLALRAEAIAQCAVMERHLGHFPEAEALLRGELSRHPSPTPEQAVPLGLALGMSALHTVSYPEVRADVERTLAVARAHGDHVGEATALALAALGEAYEGETETAGRYADAAAAIADAMTDPSLADPCESLVWLAWAEALLERNAEAERHAERGLTLARRGGRLHVLPHLLTALAYVRLNTCRLPSATEAIEEAESLARNAGSSDLLAFTLSFKTLILLISSPLGDRRARAAAEEAVAAVGRPDRWWASLAWCMLGHTLYVEGEPQRALDAILNAGGGEQLHRLQPSIRPAQLETLVNAALATGDTDRARHWAARAAEEARRIGLRGQRAAALRAEAAIAEHDGAKHAAARKLAQAAQEYERSSATLWEALSLLRAVPLAHSAGDAARAAANWRRAHQIALDGGARLLQDAAEALRPQIEVRASLPDRLAGLTPRELEIAELVAAGLSNRSIAEKLFVSPRTIEVHVSAIYRKAAVSSRAALASLITRAGYGAPTAP